ncbi:hypothetical protein DFH28DRAFT_1094555, partial [Melampsora americana]
NPSRGDQVVNSLGNLVHRLLHQRFFLELRLSNFSYKRFSIHTFPIHLFFLFYFFSSFFSESRSFTQRSSRR